MPVKPTDHRARYPLGAYRLVAIFLLALFLIGPLSAWAFLTVDGRIYPHVSSLGVDLSYRTPAEARAILAQAAGLADRSNLVLRTGDRQWTLVRSEAGIQVDVERTLQAALGVGHSERNVLAQLGAVLRGHPLRPILTIDQARIQGTLEGVATEVRVLPSEAAFRLEGEEVIAVSGRPGHELDLDATLAQVLALADKQAGDVLVDLRFRSIAPQVSDATAALDQARAMLKQPVRLSAYDVVRDQAFDWTLERSTLAGLLQAKRGQDGAALKVEANREAVRAALAELAKTLGQGRGFRLDEASEQVAQAMQAGGGSVALYLTHPARTCTLQSEETVDGLAVRYGIPAGILTEVNPGVDRYHARAGQVLTIPSEDIMLPQIPVRNKRIVISISRQRMQVYENGAQRWDWPVSTGMQSTATLPGVFQVLFKEPNAYASQWDLWMPHFLGIYRSAGEIYNGIHALPILSGGGRLWEGMLGRPASFGCIILGVKEAETLFNWAEVGVPVIVEP